MADGSVEIGIVANTKPFTDAVDDLGKDAEKAADGVEELEKEADKAADSTGELGEKAGKAADKVDDLAEAAKEAEQKMAEARKKVDDLGNKALAGFTVALGLAVAGIVSLAEETREYREDMAKLETAFSTAGHSTETAGKAYEDFFAILGESDRSVEAVNHLAELTKSEEEVAKWSTIAAGVTAKFGDSLPIEGLTEAANETAKVGQVTGPLADALNWAGISEDEFNKKLAACNSEQERATLITNTLNKEYSAAAAEYNKLTESTQAANRATSNMQQAQAELGAAVEPLITAWKNFMAGVLEALVPVMQSVVAAMQSLATWAQENERSATALKTVVVGLGTAFVALAAALAVHAVIGMVQKAFAALNAIMLANPIMLVVAAIAGLVAGFLYLWNNCEAFRGFWVGLWDGLKNAAAAVATWFLETWTAIYLWLESAVDGMKASFADAWAAIRDAWAGAIAFFVDIWQGIKDAFSRAKEILTGFFSAAWRGISAAWSGVVAFFVGIWTGIKNAFAKVADWFGQKFRDAYSAISNIWDSIGSYFKGLYDDIVGAFSKIKETFFTIGSNIINGIWEGLKAGWDWLVGKVKSLASALFGAAEKELEIQSPSKKFEYLGNMIVDGLAVGIEGEKKVAVNAIKDVSNAVLQMLKRDAEKYAKVLEQEKDGLTDLEREFATETVGIWEQLSTDVAALQDAYASAYESRLTSIKNALGLFSLAEKGTATDAATLTDALQSQITLLEDYNAALETLSSRGVDQEFVEEIKGMGIDATAEIEALNAMSDEELDNYVAMWKQKSELARQAANIELAGMREDTEAEIAALNDVAAEEYTKLRSKYTEQGLLLVEEMGASMQAAGSKGVETMRSQVGDYVAVGQELMNGIASGMAEQSPAVAAAASNAVKAALLAAQKEGDINSPSGLMRDEVGEPLALGVVEGWQKNIAKIKNAMAQGITSSVHAVVSAEKVRAGQGMGVADTGFYDLARSIGTQTAGINSLAAEYRRGSGSMRPVVLQLDRRELGRAVVDVGSAENTRVGTKLALGGV